MSTDLIPKVTTVPEQLSALEQATVYVEGLDDGRWVVTVWDTDVRRRFKVEVVDGKGSFPFVPQINAPCTFSAERGFS